MRLAYIMSPRAGEADPLIVNKFGKHEAMGRNFRSAIAAAVEWDVPVLLGVGALNLEAFEHFAGSFASCLDIDQSALRSWARQVCGMGPTSAAQGVERNVRSVA